MFDNSVDDDFEGCTTEMLNLVLKTYLENEKHGQFKEEWEKAEKKLVNTHLSQGLTKNHLIAMSLFSLPSPQFYKDLNDAIENGKDDYKNGNFGKYSLYFFMVDAIKHLKIKNKCQTSYRGVAKTVKELTKMSNVRFGRFASTSRSPQVAHIYSGDKTCFEILTCHGADITAYSNVKDEEEILIPPYEVFEVVDIKKNQDFFKQGKCEVFYKLKSKQIQSDLRCSVVNGQ